MKARLQNPWLRAVLTLAVASAWLCFTAASCETAFETLGRQWRDATVGWLAGKTEPIPPRDPEEQAKFWLAETDRVLAADPDNAALAMGAALLLHASSADHPYRRWRGRKDEKVRRLQAQLDNLYDPRCLELAARATRLEPHNADWQRLRALLAVQSPVDYFVEELRNEIVNAPRDPNWRATLDECARHDPDNALYDYLAAYVDWDGSSKFHEDSYGSGWNEVFDDARFQRGVISFERGQTKRHFTMCDRERQLAAEFLVRSAVALRTRPAMADSATIYQRTMVCRALHSRQHGRAVGHMEEWDSAEAVRLERQNLRLLDQYDGANDRWKYDLFSIVNRQLSTRFILDRAEKYPSILSAAERADIAALLDRATLQKRVLVEAETNPPYVFVHGTAPGSYVQRALSEFLPPPIALCLPMGLSAILLARLFAKDAVAPIRPRTRVLALLAATTFSVVVLGLAPGGVIPYQAQAWIFTLLLVLSPLAVAAAIGLRWRRGKSTFSLRELLAVAFAYCLLFGMLPFIQSGDRWYARIPFGLWIAPRGGYNALLRVRERPLREAVEQWVQHQGLLVAITGWLAVMTFLLLRSRRKQTPPPRPISVRVSEFVGVWLGMCGRSLLALALGMSIAYALTMPAVLREDERYYQRGMAEVRETISQREADLKFAIDAVEADEVLMAKLNAKTDAEIAGDRSDD